MQFQYSSHFLKNAESRVAVAKHDLNTQTNKSKLPAGWIRRFFSRLTIAKKIGYGYSLAVGIAFLGTSVGLLIGNYYQKQATEQLKLAHEQQYLLRDLENGVMAVRSHPQQLVSVLGDSIWFNYESTKFLGNVNRVKGLLSQLESFIDHHPGDVAVEAKDFKNVLIDHKNTTESYAQLTQSLWQQINPANSKPKEIQAAQQKVLASSREEKAIKINVKFERLSESLSLIIAAAATQETHANEQLRASELLRRQIIIGSMLLSAAIAACLAFYTSRAIARPLTAVTQVARRITQESNFDLQATVTTEDEVGSLATSLNQLVQRVREYTQELTQALQDLKQTQAQLIQTEKMSSLGQMVAGIAHEINNPVNFIGGNLDYANTYTQDLLDLVHLYQQQYSNPSLEIQNKIEAIDLNFLIEDLPKLLSSMKMGTDRIREIVLSLRNFSRLDEAEMKLVDIHEGIDSTLLILNHRFQPNIAVIKKYADLPLVECYPAPLNQVFMNILNNAIDALLAEDTQPSKQILIKTEKVDYNQIRVGIWDNGPGIPPEIIGKLFDPFFTTKPVGQGTDLGLSISYQIIEKHKGKIEVISEFGRGTEFALNLPIEAPHKTATGRGAGGAEEEREQREQSSRSRERA